MESKIKIQTKVALYSWWVDPKKRIWFIHSIYFNKDGPSLITLIQFGSYMPIDRPYLEISKLITDGDFIQLSPILQSQFYIKSDGAMFTGIIT